MNHRYLLIAAGCFLFAVVLSAGFNLDAAWYWWVALGVALGIVSVA